ncbi:MAG: neutral zinc metallopeptidase [Rhodospirillales bacterium]|nr:neutral zinc metallopeptidase [Rhodospirillales bacterium]
MRWRTGRRSQNIEDRRGSPMGGGFGGFRMGRGGMGFPGGIRVGRRGGVGGIGAIIFILVALFFGVDPGMFMGGSETTAVAPSDAPSTARPAAENELKDFVSVVLADTEDTWSAVFREAGAQYHEPNLVLFTGAVQSACGYAQAAMGPFYCPGDQKIYIDLGFYDDLRNRFGAPGDFAQAYVIAHEVGHHVQTLLGISPKVHAAQQRASQSEANALSVMLELQADCFAGVWAKRADHARNILEAGDIEEGLNAASAIGDDRLQRRSSGRVVPDSFTHGSSAQRVNWFRRGLESGDPAACDTFSARS